MVKHHGESSKLGQVRQLPKQPQVGCKCKLTLKLLERLMRSARTKMTREMLAILCERRKHNTEKRSHKERLTTMETHLDVLEASLEELY
ncbi:hypothetical protein BHE74_00021272 [Ensete ventricosum]|uniref:Uncharacterized protein n=1 Tax=Ensete ventricosum TaxID=4639 RepID=A0A427BCF3_ENSVE|nr:hypothetical protein B296_00000932 [Ensete ventricosum]RWW71018.1 hypothetical protein BHE74_00021272 [Ensete ventricosum]